MSNPPQRTSTHTPNPYFQIANPKNNHHSPPFQRIKLTIIQLAIGSTLLERFYPRQYVSPLSHPPPPYSSGSQPSRPLTQTPAILFPVFVHSVLAAFVVYVNQHINSDFNLPSSIVSSFWLARCLFSLPFISHFLYRPSVSISIPIPISNSNIYVTSPEFFSAQY